MFFQRRNKTFLAFLLILFTMGQGCAGSAALVTPSTTPGLELPTSSATPRPSRTPGPAFTRTLAPEVAETAYYATLNADSTASIQTIVATVQPATLGSYPSGDGQWRVEVIRYECMRYSAEQEIAYEQLKLIHLADGVEQVVADQRQSCGGLGGFGFSGLTWSPNNRYFYYTESREGGPDGMCGNYYTPSISRLDVIRGETRVVGEGHISPDQTKLAMWYDGEIQVWDLDGEGIVLVKPLKPGLAKGQITWSPDSQAITYVQTESECAPDFGTTYVTFFDLRDDSQTLIGETPMPGTAAARTPVPLGVFALIFYPPLVMDYNASLWRDASEYANSDFMVNYLQARYLDSCILGVQGPTDFNGTPVFIPVQLGDVKYSVIMWDTGQGADRSAWYIEDGSLTDYSYLPGLPIPVVHAGASEWEECKALAEEILATLHVP